MAVIARQSLAWLSVADYERLVDLAAMSNGDDVTKSCHLGVPGEADAIGFIQPSHSLGIVTVVHEFELR